MSPLVLHIISLLAVALFIYGVVLFERCWRAGGHLEQPTGRTFVWRGWLRVEVICERCHRRRFRREPLIDV